MARFIRVVGIITVSFILGCAGETKQLHMRDTTGTAKAIEFPKGTVTGAASKEQASTLAQIFVDSHDMAMGELADIKAGTKKSLENEEAIRQAIQRIEEAMQRLEETSRKTLETSKGNLEMAQKAIQMIEQLSKRQGTGEITVFFPVGSSQIKEDSLDYGRLVNFLDYLMREGKGRKVLFISIGSASAFGDRRANRKLARERAEAPREVIDKYLVNIPHEFFRVYGTGDVYSPKGVTFEEHQRYQHTRVIAFYETDQIPPLPEGPEKK
ncbi:MAG: hypothetical protein HY878_06445 [Deltaproteobacteria bacterium]|nr:hypothetical protein [Deltaproteobacteria bacterium]